MSADHPAQYSDQGSAQRRALSTRRGLASLRAVVVGILLGLVAALLAVPAATAQRSLPVDGYADYEPQVKCARKAKRGTLQLAAWLASRGGTGIGTLRACGSGGRSEHKDGRAIDWMLDVRNLDQQAAADAVLIELFADDAAGDTDALARRMGIMYVIWNDRIYSAWDGFEPRPYLHSACSSRKGCSATLRHRDHVHFSLSKKGARAKTSWYLEQQTARADATG